MQRHRRRLSPTARTYRHTRVPAYQVRRPNRDEGGVPPTGSDGGNLATGVLPEGSEPAPPMLAPGDPLQTTSTFEDVNEQAGVDTTPAGMVETATPETAPNGRQTQQLEEEDDYAEYLRSVEAAAARSRAESRGGAIPRMRPAAAIPAPEPATTDFMVPGDVAGFDEDGQAPPPHRGRTANGGEGRGRRRSKPRDTRPLLRRPKTWFVMFAMIPVLSGIVAVIYFGNLLKTTYDAYNDIHVEPTPRPVYQVNPEGTPEIVPTEQVQATLPDWDKKDKVNILLLGIDPRPDDLDPPRSDTIIVVHIDPEAESVAMLSIPRDLLVTIPGFGDDKINSAYPLGELNSDIVPGGGPSLVAQTIEANFNIRIHYFATVDFEGFRNIIDTIGGVIIDVPAPVKDDQYPTEDYGLTRVYFPTGLQKMDGERALRYARTRHGDNDISRGDRQQQVLRAMREQAINLGLITRADDLIRDAADTVRTDLNFNQMLALANLARKIDSSKITQVNLWDQGLITEHEPESEDDPFYFMADWDGVYALLADTFDTPDPAAASPTAEATATTEQSATLTIPTTGPDGTGSVETPTAPAGSESTPTTTAGETPESTATLGPEPGVDFALPVVVQNASGMELLATGGVQILVDAGFSEVYPDQTDETVETSVIYDNVDSPETCRWVAQLLGLPESAIQPGIGGTAILVVLGSDAPYEYLHP